MSKSLSLAWTDLMLAKVLLDSVVVVTNKEVHRNRSSESIISGRCTPSSLQYVSDAVLHFWMY